MLAFALKKQYILGGAIEWVFFGSAKDHILKHIQSLVYEFIVCLSSRHMTAPTPH